MRFLRQEYWSGLPFPSPGVSTQGSNLRLLHWQADSLPPSYQGSPLETLKPRSQWDDLFKVMKEKYCQSRILYKVKVSIKYKGDGNSLAVPWLGVHVLTAKGLSSIPVGKVTAYIPQATWCGKKISKKDKGETKIILEKQKLKKFVSSRSTLHEILTVFLQWKDIGQ